MLYYIASLKEHSLRVNTLSLTILESIQLICMVSRKKVYENMSLPGYWTAFDSGNLLFNLQIWVLSRFQVETRRFSWEDDCAPWQQILLREVNTSLCRTHSSNTRLQPNMYSVSNLIHNCRSKGKDLHFKGTNQIPICSHYELCIAITVGYLLWVWGKMGSLIL